jgi:5-formyltetrahydrofolate cyclo-ligase
MMSDSPTDRPSPAGTIAAAKHAARARAQSARECLEPSTFLNASSDAATRVLGLPELEGVGSVMVYAALPSEIDPQPVAVELRRRGVKIAYPRIESPGVLGVHVVDDPVDLVPGPFGLAQPDEQAPRVALHGIDAVIVPGVAFDELGMRLGYGGGYYDRLLPLLRPNCLRIGLAFDEQILSEIPAEEHDVAVDMVVTQTRVIRPAHSQAV